ncbi:MAG: tetratricopeptide repeat protein [Tepidisphaeraceae bacterium]
MSIETIFSEALRQNSFTARAAYLAEACGGDMQLRERVEGLLHAHDEAARVLAGTNAPTIAESRVSRASEGPGTTVGRYELLEVIGEGGFGTVHLAEQTQPVRRRVALKIIKLGMDTRQVIARFEQERQALAVMDHPNIAKVFDAGATDTGRPYFVMELVKGVPITDYCDEKNLTPHERLELFIPVCQAVQHAHQKGIIHRDIKPSNVLVSRQDDEPVVKVIDFGIAKATQARLTEKTVFTELRQMIGTPEYMSPEQAEGGLDIDTRTDVYSLGVLLYELLTGSTPFDTQQLRSAAYAEIQRIIREVEPPRPSTRLSTMGDSLPGIAARRNTEPAKLTRLVRGDLDWIVMKALEKDRNRRYETANGLATDVQRYLAGEAVLAAPPSRAYRVRKFVRRNARLVAATATIFVLLVGGIVGTSVGLVRADRARRAEVEQRQQADRKTVEAEQVAAFAQSILSGVDPTIARGKDTQLLREILDGASSRIDAELSAQPAVAAAIHYTVGMTYLYISAFGPAEAQLRAAEKTQTALLGPDARDTLRTRRLLASALIRQGKVPEAETAMRPVLDAARRSLGPDDRDTLKTASMLGSILAKGPKVEEAEKLIRQTLGRQREVFGEEDRDTISSMFELSNCLWSQNRFPEAVEVIRAVLEVRERKLGKDHTDTITTLASLGMMLEGAGRSDEAVKFNADALERARRIYGPNHQTTLTITNNSAATLYSLRRLPESEKLVREALEGRRRLLGEDSLETLTSMRGLADILCLQDKNAEAVPLARRALDLARARYGEDGQQTLAGMATLAPVLRADKQYREASGLYVAIGRSAVRRYGVSRFDLLVDLYNGAALLQNAGDNVSAEPILVELMGHWEKAGKKDYPWMAATLNGYAKCLTLRNDFAGAEPLFQQALAMRQRLKPAAHPELAYMLNDYAEALFKHGNPAGAESLLRECLEFLRGAQKPRPQDIAEATRSLGEVLVKLGRFAEAEPLLLESQPAAINAPPTPTQSVEARKRTSLERIVELYEQWDKSDAGHGHDAKAAEWRAKLNELPTTAPSTQPR